MLRISSHIERLLLFNDCVIIPDFGGFVLQIHPAVYDTQEHMFCPPYKDIVFNPTLKHNDGLLSESYMQLYDMDFNEAQLAIKSDIDALKKELETSETILLGKIGRFQKEDKILLYEPGNDLAEFSVGSYGLIPFYIPPVQIEQKESIVAFEQLEEEKKQLTDDNTENTVFLPVNKILSSAAGVAAAAIAIFLLISTPVKDVNKSAYTASFIPSEMIPKRLAIQDELMVEKEEIIDNKTNEHSLVVPIITVPVLPQLYVLTDPENQQTSIEVETPAVKENMQTMPVIESVSAKTYYVIIASFVTEGELNKFLSKTISSELKNMGVVKNNERIRVYADKTIDRKEAEEYMRFLRENEKYKDAWLFIGR